MTRSLDVVILSFLGLALGSPLLVLLWLLGMFDTGSPRFRQVHVGRHGRPFILGKFWTMKINTAAVASYQADPSSVTRLGKWLRRTQAGRTAATVECAER